MSLGEEGASPREGRAWLHFGVGEMPAAHMQLAELGQVSVLFLLCAVWSMVDELEAHFTAEEAEAQGNQGACAKSDCHRWGWLAPKPDKPATPRPRGKAEGFPAADESLVLDPAQARVQQFPPPTERKRGVLCAPQHPETPGKLASEYKALCDLSRSWARPVSLQGRVRASEPNRELGSPLRKKQRVPSQPCSFGVSSSGSLGAGNCNHNFLISLRLERQRRWGSVRGTCWGAGLEAGSHTVLLSQF